MDERRKHVRKLARLACDLIVTATGKRFSGNTKTISLGGAEFEASESLVRPGQNVTPGSVGILSIMLRRGGAFEALKVSCRVRYVTANTAGLEFTASLPTPADSAHLEQVVETGSNRVD